MPNGLPAVGLWVRCSSSSGHGICSPCAAGYDTAPLCAAVPQQAPVRQPHQQGSRAGGAAAALCLACARRLHHAAGTVPRSAGGAHLRACRWDAHFAPCTHEREVLAARLHTYGNPFPWAFLHLLGQLMYTSGSGHEADAWSAALTCAACRAGL